MTLDDFDAVVDLTIARLPDWVRAAMKNIDVLVVEAPDPDPDGEFGGDDLLGLYVGTPLPERDSNHAGDLPDVIYIFRQPHLALGLGEDELRAEITRTLIHEIAHYFGIDDDRLDELGWG